MPIELPLQDRLECKHSEKQRVINVPFGDGYEQTIPDGRRTARELWDLTWSNLDATERATVIGALRSVTGADYFTWTPLGDGTERRFRVTADGFTQSFPSGAHYTLSCIMKEVRYPAGELQAALPPLPLQAYSLPFPDYIQQSSTSSETQRVLLAQFNDGADETALDGINTAQQTWSITWENLTVPERDIVVTFLRNVGLSTYFTWVPYGDSVAKRFKVADTWSEEFPSGTHRTISCSIREVN